MLHDLRANSNGYPGYFDGTGDENVAKWNQILGKMEFLFREANKETCRRKNSYQEEYGRACDEFTEKYSTFGERLKTEENIAKEKSEHTHRLYMMDDVPEYAGISDKWIVAEKDLDAYRDRCMKQGMVRVAGFTSPQVERCVKW